MYNRLVKRWMLVFAAVAGMASGAVAENETSIRVPETNPDYTALFAEFDSNFLNGNGASLDDNSTGTLAWVESYHLLGMMQQYRATSETRWLDKVVTHFNRILPKRDDRLGRIDVHTSTSLKGWGTATYDKAGWHVFIVHTGMICQGPVELVREVKSNPELQPGYGAAAESFLAEIETMVADAQQFWKVKPETGEGYYTDPGMPGDGIIPLNMTSAMATVELELYHITGKPEYRDRVTKYATYFKNSLRDNGAGGYNWSYWPKTSKEEIKRGEDISHAALNVDFAARCASAGIVFTQDDLVKFATTWLKKVRKDDANWAAYVDGSGTAAEAYLPQANGRWLTLMRGLTNPIAKELYADVARAFSGVVIHMPSRALGIANLGLYKP